MRIVELFGPPGVGKTTLARRVAYRPSGYPASGAAPLNLYRAAYEVLCHQMTARLRPFMRNTVRVLGSLERILARPGSQRWLVEEGSAQRANVWALIDLSHPIQQAYLDALPVESLTICLCVADPETIAFRGAHRGRHGLTVDQAPVSLAACQWAADTLERRGATVHRFDMAQPLTETAMHLADVLHA